MAAKASSLHLTPPKPTYNGPMLPIESAHDHLPDGVVEVERVLATRSSSSRHHGTTTMEWLIKWRGCPYAEATWEVYGSFVFDAGVYAAYRLAQVHPAKQSKAQPSQAKPSTAKPSTASTAQLSSLLSPHAHTHSHPLLHSAPHTQASPIHPKLTASTDRKPSHFKPLKAFERDDGRTLREYQLEGVNWMLKSWAGKKCVCVISSNTRETSHSLTILARC